MKVPNVCCVCDYGPLEKGILQLEDTNSIKPSVRYVTFRKHPTGRVVDLLPETCPPMSTSNLVGVVASSFSAASLRNCFSVESSSSTVKTTEDELRPLPNVRHAIAQSGHTLLPLQLLVVLRC